MFQSKPLSWSQLFPCLHVSCKRICPTLRANYSLFQDFYFYYDLFFCYSNNPKMVPFFFLIVLILCRWQRVLCWEETKCHLVGVLAQLSPPSLQRREQTACGFHLFGVCNNVNYPTTSHWAESISTFFHFSFCFQLIIEGQVGFFPKRWKLGRRRPWYRVLLY